MQINDIVNRAQTGDTEAERELFRQLTVRFRFIAKQYIDNEDAEDIVQDACVTVLDKYKQESYERSFAAWAYGVLRNKIGNYYRKKKSRGDLLFEHISRNAATLLKQPDYSLVSRLRACLKKIVKISPRYARVLNLAYQGYETADICQRLNINRGNYYMLLNRSRRLLRDCLERGDQ